MVFSGETLLSAQPWYISSFPLCAKNDLRFGSVAFITAFSGCSASATPLSKSKVFQSQAGFLKTTYLKWSKMLADGSGPAAWIPQFSSLPGTNDGNSTWPVRGLVAAL